MAHRSNDDTENPKLNGVSVCDIEDIVNSLGFDWESKYEDYEDFINEIRDTLNGYEQ